MFSFPEVKYGDLILFIYLFIYQEPTDIQSKKKKDPKFKNEIFMRIDMKHSYFLNYLFAINFFCC